MFHPIIRIITLLSGIPSSETTELVDATAEDVLKLVEDLSRIH